MTTTANIIPPPAHRGVYHPLAGGDKAPLRFPFPSPLFLSRFLLPYRRHVCDHGALVTF